MTDSGLTRRLNRLESTSARTEGPLDVRQLSDSELWRCVGITAWMRNDLSQEELDDRLRHIAGQGEQ